ncbi:MAG: RagB/SusD family nutrient uptake outer membrane protein [Tannerella sp.]|jgi:hypothetical protein|nr:RagB/SusD family nutrient uptake outer membrane protein [Tannerella sp.]
MNKINIWIITFAAFVISAVSSCSESFLDETKEWKMSSQYLDTPDGIRELAVGLPSALRLTHGGEFGYALLNYGTDEFQTGSDASNIMWNEYNGGLQPVVTGGSTNRVQPATPWDYAYVSINTQNTVIAKAPEVLQDEAELRTILGEAHFMRGWSYFYLVQQWGGVPIKLNPSVTLEREFVRASREESLQQVIDDLQEAYDKLDNPANIIPGKIYKDAAAHFLAKALLYRQSEICSDFSAGTKNEDLSKALALCDEVIAHRPLAPNFVDLWDLKEYNGDNEKLPEVILSAQYDLSTKGANGQQGNNQCVHFISVYRQWTGFVRDIAGGREFARLKNTDYVYNVYDLVNDSRFWKTFRTKQALNNPGQKYGDENVNVNFAIGQLGLMYIINSRADANRFQIEPNADGTVTVPVPGSGGQPPRVKALDPGTGAYQPVLCPETGIPVPNVLPRYRSVEGRPDFDPYAFAGLHWPTMNKYLDGLRSAVDQTSGGRDAISARVAETYLIAAEVKLRQGDIPGSFHYINAVRTRAGYKTGEDRARYVDGTQSAPSSANPPSSFYGKNSYYESNNIPVTTNATDMTVSDLANLPAEDKDIIAILGYTSDFDRMLCFILNERSRELMGEMVRWTDLSRTGTLVKRAYAFNEDVAKVSNLDNHHLMRPIPQSFLDNTWKDGRPMTAEEKQSMQNPGY